MPDEDDLEVLIGRLPSTVDHSTTNLRCCCGRTDCAFLEHNSTALDDLENEVKTAATLGQALLVRHEAYMLDAERERLDMSVKIEKLEIDKRTLEAENARTIEENRVLLDQLEGLNGTVSESAAHIKSLEETLQSTHEEIRRLEILAWRTYDLELQLAALEQEQDTLQRTIITTEAEERSAIQRWKKAERNLRDLNDQLERIERESQEEKERHIEVLGRMERQRAVERELDTAAGRLKGAAALNSGNNKHTNGNNVVSHFVKDILQDNANLQMGIVELKQMLMNSNDEVQSLREQLLLHQPMLDDNPDGSAPSTLRAELAPKEEEPEPKIVQPALHIHHHYHAQKKEEIRRPKKKRTPINSAIFTLPKHVPQKSTGDQETATTILSQTSVTVPTPISPHSPWFAQSGSVSDFASSSIPSSPQSMYRHSNLFDRGFDIDSSRPTSPGSSIDPISPQFRPKRHLKRGSEVSARSFTAPVNFQRNVIHEEDADVDEIHDLVTPSVTSLHDESPSLEEPQQDDYADPNPEEWSTSFQPTLHRSASHESILSISGIDIHTLRSRPSQMNFSRRGLQPDLLSSSVARSPQVLTSSSMVTARPTLTRQNNDSSAFLRSSMGHAAIASSNSSDVRSVSSGNSNDNSPSTIGQKVGGWVFGRWGVSPVKSSNDLKASASISQPQAKPHAQPRVVSQPVDPLKAFMGRPPGINQKGPIPGFVKKDKAPSNVSPVTVDQEALREGLLEEQA